MMTARPQPLEAPLYVSHPMLPPLDQYTGVLAEVWQSAILTNGGALHNRLERAIAQRVGSGHLSLWNNGTTALMGALTALRLAGEVIVTPFTFPATVHAISALGLEPIFADIEPDTMTIAPASIADRATERTSAILGTHVYGTSCDTAAIGSLGRQLGARVVYDGAHSFGRPAPAFDESPDALGDATMLSFHATKLFHTAEGGAVVTRDTELDRRIRLIRNFGITSETEAEGVGLNGKLSELHAAMGLLVLPMLDAELQRRAAIAKRYAARLAGFEGLAVAAGLDESRQYFVVRISDAFGSTRDEVHDALRSINVHARRYFYPLVSDLDPYSQLPSARDLPVAKLVASECLALPFHALVTDDKVDRIGELFDWQYARARAR